MLGSLLASIFVFNPMAVFLPPSVNFSLLPPPSPLPAIPLPPFFHLRLFLSSSVDGSPVGNGVGGFANGANAGGGFVASFDGLSVTSPAAKAQQQQQQQLLQQQAYANGAQPGPQQNHQPVMQRGMYGAGPNVQHPLPQVRGVCVCMWMDMDILTRAPHAQGETAGAPKR